LLPFLIGQRVVGDALPQGVGILVDFGDAFPVGSAGAGKLAVELNLGNAWISLVRLAHQTPLCVDRIEFETDQEGFRFPGPGCNLRSLDQHTLTHDGNRLRL
jgi:hypothetical protein